MPVWATDDEAAVPCFARSDGRVGAEWATAVLSAAASFFHQASLGVDLQPTSPTPATATRPAARIDFFMASMPLFGLGPGAILGDLAAAMFVCRGATSNAKVAHCPAGADAPFRLFGE
jgi:hypothetical protein